MSERIGNKPLASASSKELEVPSDREVEIYMCASRTISVRCSSLTPPRNSTQLRTFGDSNLSANCRELSSKGPPETKVRAKFASSSGIRAKARIKYSLL